jgi:hypothetical protein
MKKRGRKLGWWKIWTPQGLRDMTVTEESAIKQRRIQQHGLNADLIAPWKALVKSERLARLSSPEAADRRLRKATNREDVKVRNLRIHNIAKEISAKAWQGKFNSWIAQRLAGGLEQSVNTIRADVAAAKKFLMSNQRPKN